jgi:hypothetical protein
VNNLERGASLRPALWLADKGWCFPSEKRGNIADCVELVEIGLNCASTASTHHDPSLETSRTPVHTNSLPKLADSILGGRNLDSHPVPSTLHIRKQQPSGLFRFQPFGMATGRLLPRASPNQHLTPRVWASSKRPRQPRPAKETLVFVCIDGLRHSA